MGDLCGCWPCRRVIDSDLALPDLHLRVGRSGCNSGSTATFRLVRHFVPGKMKSVTRTRHAHQLRFVESQRFFECNFFSFELDVVTSTCLQWIFIFDRGAANIFVEKKLRGSTCASRYGVHSRTTDRKSTHQKPHWWRPFIHSSYTVFWPKCFTCQWKEASIFLIISNCKNGLNLNEIISKYQL